jgi:hypothetical protein
MHLGVVRAENNLRLGGVFPYTVMPRPQPGTCGGSSAGHPFARVSGAPPAVSYKIFPVASSPAALLDSPA